MIIERFIESHKLTSLHNTDKMFLKDTDKMFLKQQPFTNFVRMNKRKDWRRHKMDNERFHGIELNDEELNQVSGGKALD